MQLDERRILDTAQGVKNGINTREDLKKLLGGERLNDIFDEGTVNALLDTLIENGKIHSMIQNGNGLDILEGLVNQEIKGDLSNFYMINPEYILKLSSEQQKNIADSISNGRPELSKALQIMWSKKIRTEACTTKSSDNIPMLQLNIKANEIEKQEFVQQLYEQEGIEANGYFLGYEKNTFLVNLSGDKLYDYLQGENIPTAQEEKENIFASIMKENLQFCKEMHESYVKNDMDTKEIDEEIMRSKKWLTEFENRNHHKSEKQQEAQSQESRKDWELEPEMKKQIQKNSAEIAKNHRKQAQQEQQLQNENQIPTQTAGEGMEL